MDFNQPFTCFRYFEFKQFDQQLGRSAAQEQLRATGHGLHVLEKGANSIAGTEAFTRNHLGFRQQRFSTTQLDNAVAAFHPFDHAGYHFALALGKLLYDLLALGLAHLLHDNLFRSLRRNTTEFDRFQRLFDIAADLDIRIAFFRFAQTQLVIRKLDFLDIVVKHFPATECIVFAGLTINRNTRINVFLVALSRCCGQRRFHRLENNFLLHAFFARDGVHNHQYFVCHVFLF